MGYGYDLGMTINCILNWVLHAAPWIVKIGNYADFSLYMRSRMRNFPIIDPDFSPYSPGLVCVYLISLMLL